MIFKKSNMEVIVQSVKSTNNYVKSLVMQMKSAKDTAIKTQKLIVVEEKKLKVLGKEAKEIEKFTSKFLD